jgi:hypothetical protein
MAGLVTLSAGLWFFAVDRPRIVSWLVEVVTALRLTHETLHTAVSLLDRFVAQSAVRLGAQNVNGASAGRSHAAHSPSELRQRWGVTHSHTVVCTRSVVCTCTHAGARMGLGSEC